MDVGHLRRMRVCATRLVLTTMNGSQASSRFFFFVFSNVDFLTQYIYYICMFECALAIEFLANWMTSLHVQIRNRNLPKWLSVYEAAVAAATAAAYLISCE